MGRLGAVPLMVAAVAFGLVLAVIPADQRRLSIDLWLAGVAIWLGVGLSARALGALPIARAGLRSPFRLVHWPWLRRILRQAPSEPGNLPRNLLALEGAMVAAVDSPRAFAHRLRPRLRAAAAHRLRVDRGIDLDRDREAARAVLGDTAWLIDAGAADAADRAPTPAELARFLDRLSPDLDEENR